VENELARMKASLTAGPAAATPAIEGQQQQPGQQQPGPAAPQIGYQAPPAPAADAPPAGGYQAPQTQPSQGDLR
jgi:hypothetical protein